MTPGRDDVNAGVHTHAMPQAVRLRLILQIGMHNISGLVILACLCDLSHAYAPVRSLT